MDVPFADVWMTDLARRLELGADLVDDLAASAWVPSEPLRERLFGVEAQLWRISREVRRRALSGRGLDAAVVRDLAHARRATERCVALRACEDDLALAKLLELAHELDEAARGPDAEPEDRREPASAGGVA